MINRLEPLHPDDCSEEIRAILNATVRPVSALEADGHDTAKPLNILATIAHQPDLLQPFLSFAAAVNLKAQLERRDSELLALRTAWNCRSPFEWGHHVIYARAAGLTDDEIARLALPYDEIEWDAHSLCLIRAADELHAVQKISDEVWQELSQKLSSGQLVELTFVVGMYTMLSMVANSTGVALESKLPTMPAG